MTTTSPYDHTASRVHHTHPVHDGPSVHDAPSALVSAAPVAPAPVRRPGSRLGPEEDFPQDLSALGPGGAAGDALQELPISPASEALAVELRPHSPTQWIATYYPMVTTPAGRWADVSWVLHQHLIPSPADSQEPAQWLETTSPDPDHPCYTAHRGCAPELAAGYTTALATYDAETTETTEEPFRLHQAQQQRAGTIVIPAEQLSEWVLDDLRDCPGSP